MILSLILVIMFPVVVIAAHFLLGPPVPHLRNWYELPARPRDEDDEF